MPYTDLKYIPENTAALMETLRGELAAASATLESGSGRGNDFLGWQTLPEDYDREEYGRIKRTAARIREQADTLVVIGIGGSYLGARAVIEAIRGTYHNERDGIKIYFAGNSVSADSLNELLTICRGASLAVNVISKSGTTTEPAVAFRAFYALLKEKYGDAADERVYVTTDRQRGALKEQADAKGWESFVIPDNVGGRYSVLTAVGLLPIAAAGCDTDALLEGAKEAMNKYSGCDNDCADYALARYAMQKSGKCIEMLISFEPRLNMLSEWFKQLFGESEGKEGKGLFPASCTFSTDLHSMGQYIQDGQRILFETLISIAGPQHDIPLGDADDPIAFLNGKSVAYVNKKAEQGTLLAHCDGGVPNIVLQMERLDERSLGELIYFFEKACGLSAYMLKVNPFDQPGVEDYKKNMFALLGKRGYEKLYDELSKRLGN